MPWKECRIVLRPTTEYQTYRREGESAEFLFNDQTAAAAAYQLAVGSARNPFQRCEAQLGLGRAFTKAGESQEASTVYQLMMRDCDAVADEDGVSFGLYAAERLDAREYVRER